MNGRGWYCVTLNAVYLHARLAVASDGCRVCFLPGRGCGLRTVTA